MRERIREAMATVFDRPLAEIPDDASAESLEDWDSLHHLELVLELELEFGVRVPAETVPELLSVEAIEETLHELAAS